MVKNQLINIYRQPSSDNFIDWLKKELLYGRLQEKIVTLFKKLGHFIRSRIRFILLISLLSITLIFCSEATAGDFSFIDSLDNLVWIAGPFIVWAYISYRLIRYWLKVFKMARIIKHNLSTGIFKAEDVGRSYRGKFDLIVDWELILSGIPQFGLGILRWDERERKGFNAVMRAFGHNIGFLCHIPFLKVQELIVTFGRDGTRKLFSYIHDASSSGVETEVYDIDVTRAPPAIDYRLTRFIVDLLLEKGSEIGKFLLDEQRQRDLKRFVDYRMFQDNAPFVQTYIYTGFKDYLKGLNRLARLCYGLPIEVLIATSDGRTTFIDSDSRGEAIATVREIDDKIAKTLLALKDEIPKQVKKILLCFDIDEETYAFNRLTDELHLNLFNKSELNQRNLRRIFDEIRNPDGGKKSGRRDSRLKSRSRKNKEDGSEGSGNEIISEELDSMRRNGRPTGV